MSNLFKNNEHPDWNYFIALILQYALVECFGVSVEQSIGVREGRVQGLEVN